MKTKITQNMKAIILGLVIALGAGYVSAWTGPSLPPTAGNVPAPINVGGVMGVSTDKQTKTGDLTLNGITTALHLLTSDLTVTNPDVVTPVTVGQVLTAIDTTGKVGWGNATGGTSGSPSVRIFTPSEISKNGVTNLGVWDVCSVAGSQTGNNTSVGDQYFYLTENTSTKVWSVNASAGNNGYINVVCSTGGGSSIVSGNTSGTIGGGCYATSGTVSGGGTFSFTYRSWGNATNCNCPTAYTQVPTSGYYYNSAGVGVSQFAYGGYSCVKN